MAVSESVRVQREQLFPGREWSLEESDPDLVGFFDSFAFDEVPSHGDLDERTRLMCQLAAIVALGARDEFDLFVRAALTVGVSPTEVKEVVYQCVPYAGMARVRDFVHATNAALTERGVTLPLPSQSTTSPQTRAARGRAVQEKIIGVDVVAHLYAAAAADEQHIQQLLSANCFGDHYTRTGLDVPTRELLTFAMLVALGGCDPQVRGHVGANVRVGNDRTVLIAVLTQLLPLIGYPRTLNGLRAVDDVAPVTDVEAPR